MASAKERLLAKMNAKKLGGAAPVAATAAGIKAITTETTKAIAPAPVSDAKAKLLNKLGKTTAPRAKPTGLVSTTGITEAAPQEMSEAMKALLQITPELDALEELDCKAFVAKLPQLAQGVESRAPGVANYLREILKNLNKYPELTHLLNDDQLGVICSGMLFQTDTEMAQLKTKTRGKKELTINEMESIF